MRRRPTTFLALLAGLSAGLHLIWENAQAPLFAGYQNFWQHLPLCLWGTAGDVAFTLAVYGGVAAVTRNSQWVAALRWFHLAGLAALGALVAIANERFALSTGRWAYTPAMPLLPNLAVGLTPVLQMAILLPLTLWLAGRYLRRKELTHP